MKSLVLLLAGCVLSLACAAQPGHHSASAPVDWPQAYQPITDVAAQSFVERGLAYATEVLGEPAVKVRQVDLRLSVPNDPQARIKRGFALTELNDMARGRFTIYLSQRPERYAFHGQLAHEIAHLLNARIYDTYVEGLSTAFAERFLAKDGKDWRGWPAYLRNDDPYYGTSYFLMKAVWEAVGDHHIKSFLSYAVYSDPQRTRMHIDINAWLASLPAAQYLAVRQIIARHAPAIIQAAKQRPGHIFWLPAD